MPCTSCMVEYNRKRKEHGCPKCGFSFCEKCLKYKMAISPNSPKEVPICYNCFCSLNEKEEQKNAIQKNEKMRKLPSNNVWSETDELPPPSLRSLFSNKQATTRGHVGGQSRQTNADEEWANLEARLQRLNEPIHPISAGEGASKVERKGQTNKTGAGGMAELEERLAALKGVPVDVIRRPRLLVMNEDEDEGQELMGANSVEELLQQAEARIRLGQSGASANDGLINVPSTMVDENNSSTSSMNAHDSSEENLIIRKAINGHGPSAHSSISDISSKAGSEQIYPNFAECIRKTIEDAKEAEKEAMKFVEAHRTNEGEERGETGDGQRPTTSQQRKAGEEQDKAKSKISRFFR